MLSFFFVSKDHFLVFACSYSWPKWASTFNAWTVNCFALGHSIKGICSKASAWQQGLLVLRQMGKAGWSDCKSYHNSYLLGIALYYAFLSVDKSSSRHDRCTWESDVYQCSSRASPCQSWIGRSKWLINKKDACGQNRWKFCQTSSPTTPLWQPAADLENGN